MDCTGSADPSLQIKVPTQRLREKIRAYTKLHREKLRANSLDSLRFGIGEIKAKIEELENLTEKDVISLAGRIKRRKHATNDDMYRLSHAFLQDAKNIESFSKIPGAMQVLIKELTGKESERQLSSAECLCNLSLGQAPVCEKISSLAGSYLVTYLHTTENQLVRICLWTMANILATGVKGALTLMQMKLFPQLWKLYTDDDVADDTADFREDAAVCLQIIALNSEMLLDDVDREYILKHFVEKNPTCLASEYHLQIIFHSLFFYPELVASFDFPQQQYIISYSLSNICNTKEFKTSSQHLRVFYSIRVLGNILACHPGSYSILLQHISINCQTNLVALLNALFAFKNPYLSREVLWFINNMLNFEKSTSLSQKSFIEKLSVPKNNSFTFSAQNGVESMLV